jgi:hypothetical protein
MDHAFKYLICLVPIHIFEYFAPEIYANRAKGHKVEFLDTHIPLLGSKSNKGSRICDVCLSLLLNTGIKTILFIEKQYKHDKFIPLRMFDIFCRLRSSLIDVIIFPLCIFTGKIKRKIPTNHYILQDVGLINDFQFTLCTVDTLDETQLEADKRPFAMALLAAKKMLEAGNDPAKRGEFAVYLANRMLEKGWLGKWWWSNYYFFIYLLFKMYADDISKEHEEAFTMAGKPIDQVVKDSHVLIAKAEGRKEGKKQTLTEIINHMRSLGKPIHEIASTLNISVDQVSQYLQHI